MTVLRARVIPGMIAHRSRVCRVGPMGEAALRVIDESSDTWFGQVQGSF